MHRGLDSFRAIAFLLVFLFHTKVAGFGYLGVQAFFVLSGFLLTPILIEMKDSLPDREFFLKFYARRALRIFPLYYFYLLGIAAALWMLQMTTGEPGWQKGARFFEQLPFALTYTFDFLHASKEYQPSPLISHFWSLSVEEQFYLLWPLAIWCVPAERRRWALATVVFVGPLVRFLTGELSRSGLAFWLSPSVDLPVYVLPFSHFDAFAIGGYFALYVRHNGNARIGVLFGFLIAAGLVSSWLATGRADWNSLGYTEFMKDSYKYVWGYSLFNLMFALILVAVRERRFLPQLMEHRALAYLGTISYGLYVYHFPIVFAFQRLDNIVPGPLLILLKLAITIIVAGLSYHLMEKRFLRLKDRHFSKVAPTAANTVQT